MVSRLPRLVLSLSTSRPPAEPLSTLRCQQGSGNRPGLLYRATAEHLQPCTSSTHPHSHSHTRAHTAIFVLHVAALWRSVVFGCPGQPVQLPTHFLFPLRNRKAEGGEMLASTHTPPPKNRTAPSSAARGGACLGHPWKPGARRGQACSITAAGWFNLQVPPSEPLWAVMSTLPWGAPAERGRGCWRGAFCGPCNASCTTRPPSSVSLHNRASPTTPP